MGVDIPQMMDTYEANMEEQIEKAVEFETEIKQVITQYEMEAVRKREQNNSDDGFTTPNLSEGSGQPCLLYTSPSPRDRG